MAFLPLFNAVNTGKLVESDTSKSAVAAPSFTQGDATVIEYTALFPASPASIAAPWQKMLVAGYSLQIGLFDASGNQLAYQNTFTADSVNNTYTGKLTQDSGKVSTALSGVTAGGSVNVYLEIKLTNSTGDITTALPATLCKLYKSLIATGATTIPTGEIAAYKSWVVATFVPKEASAGDVEIKADSAGKKYLFYVGTDGALHIDPIQT